MHPRTTQPNGKRALLLYQSHAKREWFVALKQNKGFNIEHIGETLLWIAADEIDRKVQREDFEAASVKMEPVKSCQKRLRPVSNAFDQLPLLQMLRGWSVLWVMRGHGLGEMT
ncbi:hypothetical protein EDB83DRAFT_2649694 [Lactarius deliciosus]|nr:hypothetical protein EDB83DRAFT_2649694 [Lactarius deliciosus]